MKTFRIGNHAIGNGRTFIIAEAGVNHNGKLDLALQLVREAKKCGADAIKFQSFRADYMCVRTLTETKSVEGVTGGTKSSYDMYRALELSQAYHEELKKEADRAGILFLTSVFDEPMVDFLFRLGVPAFKISSGDISYKQLIQKAGLTRLPVILSTGMARPEEIKKAVRWLKNVHCRKMAILHCVAVYPPKWEDLHLRYIPSLKKTFHCPAGFSDHTADDAASLAAVALGADIIEKHFTLANDMPGPDHKLSLDPAAFSAMVRKVRAVEQSLGSIRKKLGRDELKCLETGRRSLKARAPVPAGTVVSPENTILIKPTKGIAPEEAEKAYGRRAKRAIAEGETIEWKDLEKKR